MSPPRPQTRRERGKYSMDGTDQEESADVSAKWIGEETEGLATEEVVETAGGGGHPGVYKNGAGIGRKCCGRVTRGYISRRRQHLGCHLRGRRQGGSGRPPWGETRGKGEGCQPA